MRRVLNRRWFRGLLALVLVGALCFGGLLCAVLYGSHDQVQGQPATMLILGCQVYPWGPSVLLKDRLDKALTYLEDKPDMTILVSGGKGPDEHDSEAACMRDYLIAAGIDEDRILVEDRSHNTWQNMQCSVQVMEEQGLCVEDGVLIVSNGFHLTRSRMLWDRVVADGEPVSTLAAPSTHVPSKLLMYLREPLALAKSFVFDR